MKIATWNVNSLKVRLPHVLDWLAAQQPDVLCLQELKCDNATFPTTELREAGWHAAVNGQKTYNGVALISRHAAQDIHFDLPGMADDAQKRLIAASFGGVRVLSAYFPTGQALDSDKFVYKMNWLAALENWLRAELARHPQLVLAGDFNIAPTDEDAHESWMPGSIHVSAPERAAFARLLNLGLHDAFRLFTQPEKSWSWWDYRMGAFRRNIGLRIDHLLVSDALRAACTACTIDRAPRAQERPSDHAPVVLELADAA